MSASVRRRRSTFSGPCRRECSTIRIWQCCASKARQPADFTQLRVGGASRSQAREFVQARSSRTSRLRRPCRLDRLFAESRWAIGQEDGTRLMTFRAQLHISRTHLEGLRRLADVVTDLTPRTERSGTSRSRRSTAARPGEPVHVQLGSVRRSVWRSVLIDFPQLGSPRHSHKRRELS